MMMPLDKIVIVSCNSENLKGILLLLNTFFFLQNILIATENDSITKNNKKIAWKINIRIIKKQIQK